MSSIKRLLIANRGEIAKRVIQSAHRYGLETVAVYTESDRNSAYVGLADHAVYLGDDNLETSYLNIAALINAARTAGVDAVHPGYGFLSENAEFATACLDAGLVFLGPNPEAIALMANKNAAKATVAQFNVPLVPGVSCKALSAEDALAQAKQISFPVLIKAAAGGGGRGMRIIHDEASFIEQFIRAHHEAKSAFADDELLLEKALLNSKHIEVQVAADLQGNIIHLFERDCTVQRRHQKIIEEAPAASLSVKCKKTLYEAAINVAKSVNYSGIGTIEFLVDENESVYFIEMNTRIQVEHGVTELVTHQDLVQMQFDIANGFPLPKQEEIKLHGHAIEARLYAEDPVQNFIPQTGTLEVLALPAENDFLRVDHDIVEGQQISARFDPMLIKFMTQGRNREQANARMMRALKQSCLLGLNTNQQFLIDLLSSSNFESYQYTTEKLPITAKTPGQDTVFFALAATQFNLSHQPSRFGLNHVKKSGVLLCKEHSCHYDFVPTQNDFQITISEDKYSIQELKTEKHFTLYEVNGITYPIYFYQSTNTLHIAYQGQSMTFYHNPGLQLFNNQEKTTVDLLAPSDGVVIAVEVQEQSSVKENQCLIVLEAMKIEQSLKASHPKTIKKIYTKTGDVVKKGQLLIQFSE